MVFREGRHVVITFIDYSAAFNMEGQFLLDSALADAGVSVKVRRIIQAIFVNKFEYTDDAALVYEQSLLAP